MEAQHIKHAAADERSVEAVEHELGHAAGALILFRNGALLLAPSLPAATQVALP